MKHNVFVRNGEYMNWKTENSPHPKKHAYLTCSSRPCEYVCVLLIIRRLFTCNSCKMTNRQSTIEIVTGICSEEKA